jgi:hypothetical protein
VGWKRPIHLEKGILNTVAFWGGKASDKKKQPFDREEKENDRTGNAR